MPGPQSNVTEAAEDGSHSTKVPVQDGQTIVLDDFYSWPTFLVRAQRSAEQALVCQLAATDTPPTLPAKANYDREPEGGGRRLFSDEELEHVKQARSKAPVGKLTRAQDMTKGHNVYGWKYNGIIPSGIPESLGRGPKGSLEYAKGQVWLELMSEGGVAAINAYDNAKFSWGQGWALKGGLLFLVMDPIFKKPAYGALRRALLDHGIAWDPSPNRKFLVVNDDGYMETGDAAMNLIQGSPDILASFIEVGEAAGLGDLLLAAEVEAFLADPATKVPSWALNWDDDLIRFAAHVGHLRSVDAWQDNGGSIREYLLAWANRTKGGAKGAWKEHASGGITSSLGPIMLAFLQQWGTGQSGNGHGIAWKAVSGVCPTPISVSHAELDDAANASRFGGLLFFPAGEAPADPHTKMPFYVYPSLPPGMNADDDLYAFVGRVGFNTMNDILKEVEALKKKVKIYRDLYNESQSPRTVGSYGYRTRVAMDAVLAHGLSGQAKDKATHTLYGDKEFQVLPTDQQDLIRNYLKTKNDIWSFWDDGDASGFMSRIQGYAMTAFISTLSARNYAAVDKVRQTYEGQGKPYGWRPWIAMVTVLNRGGGQAAGWIITHPGYKELPRDQRKTVRQTLGLPHSDADVDAET